MKKTLVTIVTGTPATGKTMLAKKLAKKQKACYIDVQKVIKENRLDKHYSKKWQSYLVDVDKLNKHLIRIIQDHRKIQQPIIIDSHLSHYLPKKYVDLCI